MASDTDGNPRARSRKSVMMPRRLIFGLRWEYAERSDATGPEVFDLDAYCIALDRENRIVEIVHPGLPLQAIAGIRHAGDSHTGGGGGDDERLALDLDALPERVTTLVILVASMSGCRFGRIPGVVCRLSDQEIGSTLLTVDLHRHLAAHNAYVVVRVTRSAGEWRLEACNE